MSDFMNNLNKVGMILQAGGGSLAGRDGMGVVREYQAQQEDERRKAAIAGLLQQSGIGGVQRGLIEQLPVGEQAPVILNMLAQMEAQRRAGGAAGAAAARDAAAQEARMAQWQALMGAGQPQQAPGGFSLGETLTDVPAPSAPLSFGLPSAMPQAMPAPPPASMPMSFGEIVPSAPPPPPSPYNMYRRALEQAYMAPPGTIDPEVIKGLEERLKFFAPPETEMFDPDRYRVVGNTLYDLADLDANGRPRPVAESAGQQEVIFGADGQPIVARGPVGADFRFTEAQGKDNVYATRAEGALALLDSVGAEALADRQSIIADAVPFGLARGLQPETFQVAQQAGNEFLQAILRKDTGAAITADEQALYGQTFLPQPGDQPQVLEAKRQARIRALEALKSGMNIQQLTVTQRALIQAAERAGQQQTGYAETPIVGGKVQPPETAIEILRSNPSPEYRQYFDEVFGEGAAARALGQ